MALLFPAYKRWQWQYSDQFGILGGSSTGQQAPSVYDTRVSQLYEALYLQNCVYSAPEISSSQVTPFILRFIIVCSMSFELVVSLLSYSAQCSSPYAHSNLHY